MRKKINIIVCIMIAVCVLAFSVACQPKDADGLIKLSTPKNLALNGSSLSWDEVKNAQEYFISVDGKEVEKSVTSTTYDLSTAVVGYGNFSIAVRAYGDGKKYGTSNTSAPIVYHKGNALNTPIVAIDGQVASWSAVEFAVNYSIRVIDADGKVMDEAVTEELKYNFADKKVNSEDASTEAKGLYEKNGAYRISVIANPAEDNIEYSPSLAGVATYYNSMTLSVPKFTYMTGTTIRWETVSNATNYTLRKTYEDGTFEEATVSGTSYAYRTKFNLEKVGKYYFTVKANGDNQVYYSSAFSDNSEDYSLNKLAALEAQDVTMKYEGRAAKLSWKVPATSLAAQVTLNLSALLPDGSVKLESTLTQKTISNTVVFVEGDVYDFYKYDNDEVVKGEGKILLYNMDGYAKVHYNGGDYFLKEKNGVDDIMWKNYRSGGSIDIVCDMSNLNKLVFVNDAQQLNDSQTGDLLVQNTKEKEDVLDSQGKQLYYFDKIDGESDLDVKRELVYDGDEVIYHTFELNLDDIFIKEVTDDAGTTYEYLLKDQHYGILYNVSLSLDNDSKNYVASESVTTPGQYLSYKLPQKNSAGAYVVTNAGEYAYIMINSFINEANTDTFSIEENINFNGYEVVQIDSFSGVINGNKHTVSGIVIGNKVLTANGVVESEDKENLKYTMFVNINGDNNSTTGVIENVFYVGVGFVGYDKDELSDETKSIAVAPIAINNNGTIRNALVQSDSIKAEGADVAGLVINNNKFINSVFVYAQLEGRNVGGVMINNADVTAVANSGFNGNITATLGEILTDGVTSIGGAGFVVNNNGNIANSFTIGNVSVNATGLDSIYAGGFVAVNNSDIVSSYSGEFTLNNVFTSVVANGDHAYAGGFVGYNAAGEINSCYATNKATASVYAGGFVGYNEASISSSYSTGGTTRTGEHRGAFVGVNDDQATIQNCISYSTDDRAEDTVVDVLTSSEELAGIVEVLYPQGNAEMVMLRDRGYRNPLLKYLMYTKDNIVTIRPGGEVLNVEGVTFNSETRDAEATLYGDNSKKGNKVVIELSAQGASSRFIYGYVN